MTDMAIIKIETKNGLLATPCPYGRDCYVASMMCRTCPFFKRIIGRDNSLECGHYDSEDNKQPTEEIRWRKCKAGYKFPSDAIVIPQDERTTDTDPRLVRCAVWDSIYILVSDLKKLPIEK